MKTLVLLLLLVAAPTSAGWRRDCRDLARTCRLTHGEMLTTTTIATTTTTMPVADCGMNCHGATCIVVDGTVWVRLEDALTGACSLP